MQLHFEDGDLLAQDAIRSVVRQTYGAIEPTDRGVADRFYAPDDLVGLPAATVRMALGVGNPVRHAGLKPGQDVVDRAPVAGSIACSRPAQSGLPARSSGSTSSRTWSAGQRLRPPRPASTTFGSSKD